MGPGSTTLFPITIIIVIMNGSCVSLHSFACDDISVCFYACLHHHLYFCHTAFVFETLHLRLCRCFNIDLILRSINVGNELIDITATLIQIGKRACSNFLIGNAIRYEQIVLVRLMLILGTLYM